MFRAVLFDGAIYPIPSSGYDQGNEAERQRSVDDLERNERQRGDCS